MKLLFCFLLITCSLFAQDKIIQDRSEEIILIEDFIQVTKKRLEEAKKILQILHQYHEQRVSFLQDPTSAKYASQLVRVSMKLQKDLENSPLTSLFSSQFLEEVAFFSNVGKKALDSHEANSVQR